MLLDKGPLPGYFFISFVFFFLLFFPAFFPLCFLRFFVWPGDVQSQGGPGVGNDAVTDQGPFVGYLLATYQ